jgi:hypothetical protein
MPCDPLTGCATSIRVSSTPRRQLPRGSPHTTVRRSRSEPSDQRNARVQPNTQHYLGTSASLDTSHSFLLAPDATQFPQPPPPTLLRLLGSMRQPSASLLARGTKRRSRTSAVAGPGRARRRRPWRGGRRPGRARPWRIPSSARRRWMNSSTASASTSRAGHQVSYYSLLRCSVLGLGFANLPGQVLVLMPSPPHGFAIGGEPGRFSGPSWRAEMPSLHQVAASVILSSECSVQFHWQPVSSDLWAWGLFKTFVAAFSWSDWRSVGWHIIYSLSTRFRFFQLAST